MWNIFGKKSNAENNRNARTLSELSTGQQGYIDHISNECSGIERRRLMDLGFVPGSKVEAAITSPFRDPVAYRIKGALIALRKQQAEKIRLSFT